MNEKSKHVSVVTMIAAAISACSEAHLIFTDDSKPAVGKYAEYALSGNEANILKGTIRVEVLDESSTQLYVQVVTNVSLDTESPEELIVIPLIPTRTEWKDKIISIGTPQPAETIDTKWGPILMEVYLGNEENESKKSYYGQEDRILYRILIDKGLPSPLEANLYSTNMRELKSEAF